MGWGRTEPMRPIISPAPAPLPPITPPPPITPMPSPVPTETAPIATAEQRRRKIRMTRYGILSTIKTSPMGLVGAGAELATGRGKTALGA